MGTFNPNPRILGTRAVRLPGSIERTFGHLTTVYRIPDRFTLHPDNINSAIIIISVHTDIMMIASVTQVFVYSLQ